MKHHLYSIFSLGLIILGLMVRPTVLSGHENPRDDSSITLIENAYRNDDIDYDTALLNKVYALFQPEKLSARFRVEGLHPQKSATPLFMEIRNNWSKLRSETRSILGPYLLRPTELGEAQPYGHAYDETTTPQPYDTPGGHFRIWYVTTTDDAPDDRDTSPPDGIPDYVNQCGDIFDYAWEQEVVELDFQAPPQDGSWYPSGEDYGDNSKFDVYIEDLGRTIFGYTQAEYYIPGSNRSAASYIVVDNDYVWYPNYNQGKQPVDGLKVTAAHEFFHAIHFGYDATSDRYWMEITAVWMEDMIYDDVDDYLAYLYWFFSDPGVSLDEFNGQHEYASCIWAMFLDQNYGTDIILDIWQRCVSTSALAAMEAALSSRGSGLEEAFKTFTVWNYFTGSRANPDLYYEEGSTYPMVNYEEQHNSYPASGTGKLNHLSAHYIGFAPQGATGGLLTSFDGSIGVNWGAMITEYQSTTRHPIADMELDAQHQGSHATRNWITYHEIVLIPSIVSVTGRNYSYSYSGEYDPTLGANLVFSATSHSFGNVTIGDSALWSLFIYNESEDNRMINSVTIAPSVFSIPDYSMPHSLIPSDSFEISITFKPDSRTQYSGELTISSDDTFALSISIPVSGKGASPDTGGEASSYALGQNFPSPFVTWKAERTYFPFHLAEETEVNITILTLTGQLVRELSIGSGPLAAGVYESYYELGSINAYWDGTNEQGEKVAAGIYFYVMKAKIGKDVDFVETRKLALIR